MTKHIEKLNNLLESKTKIRLFWLVIFSVFVSIIEAIGISAIMPFIDIATNFENIDKNQYYRQIFDFFGLDEHVNFAIIFGLFLLLFYVFRGVINLFYNHAVAHFTESLYAKITRKLFQVFLAMPYQVFTMKNSSYLTKSIVTEASLVSMTINSVLLMISEVFTIIFLYILMLFASWEITLILTAVLLIKMLFLTKTVSKKIKSIGKIRSTVQSQLYEAINRLFGNFKQIKLQDKDRLDTVRGEFSDIVDEYARVTATNSFLNIVPRLFLETIGFSIIIILLVVLLYLKQDDISYILPTLSLFVLSLYRLLPSVNRIINGYNAFAYYHSSIDIVYDELNTDREILANDIVEFDQQIELSHVDFAYKEKTVLHDVNLKINKGDKVAFVGESGSGKSTLMDLIIGICQPTRGEIRVDGVLIGQSNLQSWRSSIGYIPQQIYLFDGTIKENVCFGLKVDHNLLETVLDQANILDFLKSKQGIETLVGEGGVQLSGGQKQRIAIARALYSCPEILVLDEATSALDNETEEKIMDEVYKIAQDKTVIIVAHRLSTIHGCSKVYKVKNGRVYV